MNLEQSLIFWPLLAVLFALLALVIKLMYSYFKQKEERNERRESPIHSDNVFRVHPVDASSCAYKRFVERMDAREVEPLQNVTENK